jgi:hypothetical protein
MAFLIDWPLMFLVGILVAAVAIYRGKNLIWFSIGIVLSILIAAVALHLYLSSLSLFGIQDFMLVGLGLKAPIPEGTLIVFLIWYVVAYSFGYVVGYFPLGERISRRVSRIKKKSKD